MTILRIEDGVKIGLCVSGQRRFCAQHGIDFRDFVRNGTDIEKLAHVDDLNLTLAIEAAKNRELADGRR